MITLLGNRGGGKSTVATAMAEWCYEESPDIPVISNWRIRNLPEFSCVPNILKFLAVKLIEKDLTPMEIFIDESAIAGFESRGSGMYSLDSYLITLSRKLNINIILISQLLSMIEKRAQWLSDTYILCQAEYIPEVPQPVEFRYSVYDENLEKNMEFGIEGLDAIDYIYPLFDTNEIPGWQDLAAQFKKQYRLESEDWELFNRTVEEYGKFVKPAPRVASGFDSWLGTRWGRFWDNV